MFTDSARKRTIRNRAAATGENYTEAATRLSMLAKVPSLPAPIVHAEGERNSKFWGGLKLRDLITENWDLSGSPRYNYGNAADTQHDNTQRAGHALLALAAYAAGDGVDEDSLISDLLCDLRHLCDALGENFDEESARSERHYTAEARGEF